MEESIKRLFDIIYHQKATYQMKAALSCKVTIDGVPSWKSFSSDDLVQQVNLVSNALIKLGVEPDDKIAILSNNRPEWNFIDLGMLQIGAVNVPVYPTISEPEYKFIFNDAEVKICFVSNEEMYKKVAAIKDHVPSLEHIFSIEDVPGVTNIKELLTEITEEDAAAIEKRKAAVSPDDIATFIYTSGTTGTPKGVMLSHNNLISNVKAVSSVLPIVTNSKALSFLPLCHSFERTVCYVYMANGVSIYYAESVDTLGENLKEVRPDYFTTVPRLLEKVYEKIMEKGNALTGFKHKLFFWALDLGMQYELNKDLGWWYNMQLGIARKLVFSKWKEALGGNIKFIVTGAAALQPRLGKVFTAAEIPIVEGYGLTETSPVLTSNRVEEEDRCIGTVGPTIPGVEIKIAEDGEILARGPGIMVGYYKRQDLTDEVIDADGWFHTGDIGTFVDDKFLKITDRKKELFKTSGGKYVAPQPLENIYKESPLIEQIMIIGENRKFVSALIVPSYVNLKSMCEKRGIAVSDNAEMIENEEVIKEITQAISDLNVKINHVEQVKAFKLLPEEWSLETGELTPTLKLKRRVILESFAGEIESLYA